MNDIELLQGLASHAKSESAWNIAEQVESIATKYESMARAVLWAYDRRMEAPGCTCLECLNNEELVERATGKHPSDWTRDGLMKHLGIAQEESK